MKVTKIFMMAALAVMTAACSNDDRSALPLDPVKNDLGQQSAGVNGEITITATLEAADGATTRALSIDGSNIASNWANTDQFAILYMNGTEDTKSIATVKSINASTVTITFTIPATLANNTACTIVYPASAANDDNTGADVATALATQDGTIGNCPEVRVGTATIDKDNHNLSDVTKLAPQNAVFKFTVQDLGGTAKSASEFKVSDNAGNVFTTVEPTSAASELYVALPVLSDGTYWFNATADSKPYIAKATVSTATSAGNYYQSTVKMATLGDLMGDDGKFYANATAITAPTKAIGVIAYLGSDATTEAIANGGGHGLVLCLKNAASGRDSQWSTEKSTLEFGDDAKVTDATGLKRTTNVSGYTNTKTLAEKTDAATKYKAAYAAKNYTDLTAPTGTTGWFLPSAQQWVKMIEGLGGLTDGAPSWASWFDNSHTGATAWEAALSKAGSGNYDSMTSANHLWYWSSSEYSALGAVYLDVDATNTGDYYGFYWDIGSKDYTVGGYRVRPVLAF